MLSGGGVSSVGGRGGAGATVSERRGVGGGGVPGGEGKKLALVFGNGGRFDGGAVGGVRLRVHVTDGTVG